MDNASLILQTLDGHLNHPARLILYGRAAIQLGFTDPPRDVAASKDVDAIIPRGDLAELSADVGFWDAQEATNAELRPKGLYITHLFRADQIFLRRDWEQHLVPITRPPTRWLRLFRPATLDLILTKMMRGDDPQDMADIAFLIRHDHITPAQIEGAFTEAVIPDLVELRDAFERAKPRVRELGREAASES
ncbi:MAG: hypothetical protein HYY24_11340 [Verrucomicrobia bacterium]|nr:hypothetical protein [Verrucomicrobiota bacterium]